MSLASPAQSFGRAFGRPPGWPSGRPARRPGLWLALLPFLAAAGCAWMRSGDGPADSVSHSPGDAAMLVARADAHIARHNWHEAGLSIEAALERDPAHVPALVSAARLAERSGDDAAALALYHRALNADPGNSAARLGVAAVHVRRNRLSRAVPLLRAVAQDPRACPAERAEALRTLGQVMVRQERWSEAALAFESAVACEERQMMQTGHTTSGHTACESP
ncbi:MAG TPA: tetratricopeptide repeat protein [Planctomycetaceae bacterium]|nr:tetratricopeptide repeat protein [Planctomycetaceae bacterium]